VVDRVPRLLITAHLVGMMGLAVGVMLWALGAVKMGAAAALPGPLRWLIGIFAATVCIVDLAFLRYRFYANRESHLKARTDDGIVSIAVGAVEESLARTAKSLPEVHDARVRVFKEKGDDRPVNIVVNYAAWEDSNVREVTRKVQQACMMRFEQIAGREIQPNFSIYLSRIDVKTPRKPSRRFGSEEEPVDLFRGPRYPSGGEL
jgi:hypothetical protein